MEAPKKDCCHGECDHLMQDRLHYFTGRHLSARDLSDEQSYHRTHRYLHNRMLHGWGVVCGLEVVQHDQEDCRTNYVRVGAGMALDCCGREIVVERAACCADEQPEIPWDQYNSSKPWLLLCLSYAECGKEQLPVISDSGDCSTEKTAAKFGRYRESWQLEWHWVSKEELRKKYGWGRIESKCPREEPPPDETGYAEAEVQEPEQHRPHHPHVHSLDCHPDDCIDPCDDGYVSCVDTKCPPRHCVPLAIICATKDQPITNDLIEMRGRPKLPYGPQRLTHVVDINWEHGGLVTTDWFKDNPLRVTFDRKLREPESTYYPGPWGINAATFVVQFGEQAEDLDFVPYEVPPALTADKLQAEYKVAPRSNKPAGYGFLEGHTLWITIKGDFIYDCHGRRVDGNNNGVEGGTFESWVTVVDKYEYERLQEEGLS
jgi:hypothetical protein